MTKSIREDWNKIGSDRKVNKQEEDKHWRQSKKKKKSRKRGQKSESG